MAGCQCAEGWYQDASGTKIATPDVHDCDYILARNALIPAAEREADLRHDPRDWEWSAVFTAAMNRLWSESRR